MLKYFRKGFVTITGSKIYYEIAQKGTPIIFIHADSLDTRQWDKQFNYFARKFQVIRYDIRGFGKSSLPSGKSYSFSEDLNLLMILLKIKKAHLVGLSLGAAIAIDFALAYPQKVYSLVLADPGIAGHGFSKEFISKIKEIIKLSKENRLEQAKNKWLNLEVFSYSQKNPAVWNLVKKMISHTSGYRWYGNNQPVDLNPLAINRLKEIKVPSLILYGEHDIADFQTKAKLLHKEVKNSKLVKIPSAGHLSNLDNAIIFNKELDKFLLIPGPNAGKQII